VDQNLARQAELAFERQGDYDTLCYERCLAHQRQMATAGPGSRPGWLAWACGPATAAGADGQLPES